MDYNQNNPKSYVDDFFSGHLDNSLSSARKVIPIVLEYIQPDSVIDIGCGIGTWLKAWKEKCISSIKGVDGFYVKKEELLIPQDDFVPFDLDKGFKDDRKYDLVSSLEVAEHIRPENADIFIRSLCALGDVILFSAAIPGQGGTFHYNEQYPDYWQPFFENNGFVAIDCLRPQLWDDDQISWWYRQNVLFFVKKDKLDQYPFLKAQYKDDGQKVKRMIRPELFDYQVAQSTFYKTTLQNPVKTVKYYFSKLFPKKR